MPEPTLEQQVETLEEKVDSLTDLISDILDFITPAHNQDIELAKLQKGLRDLQSIR